MHSLWAMPLTLSTQLAMLNTVQWPDFRGSITCRGMDGIMSSNVPWLPFKPSFANCAGWVYLVEGDWEVRS